VDHVAKSLGFSTAGAERVRLNLVDGDLFLSFIDRDEKQVQHVFRDVLGFRWDGAIDDPSIRPGATYEVRSSPWLERQAQLHGIDPAGHVHWKLGFDAAGMLEVLARRRA
jgi:hypothetical protein